MDINWLILKYPDKPWNWFSLSRNSKVDIDTITLLPNKPWNWVSLTERFHRDIILKHLNMPWDYNILLRNHVDLSIILSNSSLNWDWKKLSASLFYVPHSLKGCRVWDMIIKLSSKPWDWEKLSAFVPVDIVKKYPKIKWDWGLVMDEMYTLKKVDSQFVCMFIDLPWDWERLSTKDGIHEVIVKYPDKPWNWSAVVSVYTSKILHEGTSADFIVMFIDKPWDWDKLSSTSGILGVVYKFPEKPWNWDKLSTLN